MKIEKVVAGQLLHVVKGAKLVEKVGRVRKFNEQRGTVALEINGVIYWFDVNKVEPVHG